MNMVSFSFYLFRELVFAAERLSQVAFVSGTDLVK